MSVWNLFNTLSSALFGIMDETPDRYTPSFQDVIDVKQILAKKGTLPLELVDTIIDFAEYWIMTTTCRTSGQVTIHARGEFENKLLLRSYPLGYVPTKDNPTTLLPMTVADEYPAIPSEPWTDPDDFPHNVTQQVIDHWTMDTKPRGEVPCRKIVFTIKSHDQGWGGPPRCRGTYQGSSTWFDVGLETLSATRDNQLLPYRSTSTDQNPGPSRIDVEERYGSIYSASGSTPLPCFYIPDPESTRTKPKSILCTTRTITPETHRRIVVPDDPDENPKLLVDFRHRLNPGLDCLQRNRTATKTTTEHIITWCCTDNTDPDSVDGKMLDEQGRGRETANGEYVRNLKVGDVVTVWAKARYGGWVNTVEEVKIDVYWAV